MKIETQPREDHQVTVVAEFEPSVLEQYKQRAARKISKEAKIPGFRPGKAPFAVIRRMYGDEAIQNQAVEMMLDDVYPEVLKEADLKPTYTGSLDEIISYDPPKFSFVIPLNPEVKLGEYKSLRKDYDEPTVSDEEVDAFLKRLQNSYATAEPVERPAQEGDLVAGKLTGTLTQPQEGEEAEFIHETPFQVAIGKADFNPDNWPYPGFSNELAGMSAGDEKDITYVYPEDSEVEKMRGREIVFHVTVQSIKAMTIPELNDEFAQMMGADFDSMDKLRDAVRAQLGGTKREEYDRDYYNGLVDQIVDLSEIKYPPQMLDEEKEQVLNSIQQNLAQQRMDLDTYLKMIESDREAFVEKEVTPTAKRRLERSLVLDQIARDENIKLEDNELQSAFNEAFMELQSTTDMKEVQRKMSPERLSELLTYEAASRALNRRVMSRIKDIATGQGDKVEEPAAEAEKAPAAEAEGKKAPAKAKRKTKAKSEPTPENNEENTAPAPEE